jgi:AraC-like DNA-binding protein
MGGKEPLRRFAGVRTRDPDELRQRLSPLYAVRSLELPRSKTPFNALFNHREFQDIALSYGRYGAPVRVTMSNTDFYAQGFGVRGHGEAVVDGRLFDVSSGEGAAGGPGATARLSYDSRFEHVILKIKPEALIKKLSALLGNPVIPPLKLLGEYNRPALAAQYRLLKFVISEIDRSDDPLPPPLMAELEQALIVAFLCSNVHNYSDRLNGERSNMAPWQVRRAEGYIEANWDQRITIEALALVTDSSARSLFAAFRKSRGCSPMTFIKQVRLQHARAMLLRPDAGISVTSVALSCCFNNLGHFAKDYLASFGELPSETLGRSKGS